MFSVGLCRGVPRESRLSCRAEVPRDPRRGVSNPGLPAPGDRPGSVRHA